MGHDALARSARSRAVTIVGAAAGFDGTLLSDDTPLRELAITSIEMIIMIANVEADSGRRISDEDTLSVLKATSLGELVGILLRYLV